MRAIECSVRNRRFGTFEVDLRAAELRKHGIRIKLQEQPFHVLALLLERPGDLVTREEIRQALWSAHTYVDFDRSLNKAMTKLRFALGDSAESPRYIETIHRHGYRFLVPVSAHLTGPGEMADDHPRATGEADSDGSEPNNGKSLAWGDSAGTKVIPLQSASTSGLRRWTTFAAIALTLAAGYFTLSPHFSAFKPSGILPRRSVAVLGFRNLSGDPQQAWLSTALSDWLTTELSAGEQLRTLPGETIARMKLELGLPEVDALGLESLERVRKNLGTDLVVVGSYALVKGQEGGRVRLDLRLLDAHSGDILDAVSETGTQANLFDLVTRGGEHLRTKLGVPSTTSEEAAEAAFALPSNSEAARFYSEGVTKLRIFEAQSAQDLLSRAVAAEPGFALSHMSLASAWSLRGYDEKAKDEAKQAFDLSKNLSRAERLLVEGYYRETSADWDKAIEIYHALFEFYPDNLDYGLALASAQVKANRWKDALDTIAQLRKLPSPSSDDARIDLAEVDATRSLGDVKRAEAAATRAAERAQAVGASLLLAKARLDQAWLFENLGRFEEAGTAVREAQQIYATVGDRRGIARATTLQAIALTSKGDYFGAKRKYEESLVIHKEIGNRLGVASCYINIGDILLYLGDLTQAKLSYQSGLDAYQEVGDQDGVALGEIGLGDVFLALGKHVEARGMFEKSLEICRRIGDRSREATASSHFGEVLKVEGKYEQARQIELAAESSFQDLGDTLSAMETRLSLAGISLDEGKANEAAASARSASDFFEKMKASHDQASADALLSQSLIAQGKISEARQSLGRASTLAMQSHSRELELMSRVIEARARAATHNAGDCNEASNQLHKVVAEAKAAGFANVALEARLAIGEIGLWSQDRAGARNSLMALKKESNEGGFGSVAQKADAALRESSLRSQPGQRN